MKTIKVKSKLIHHLSDDVRGAQTGIHFLSMVLRKAEEALFKELRKEYPNHRIGSYDHEKNELTIKS